MRTFLSQQLVRCWAWPQKILRKNVPGKNTWSLDEFAKIREPCVAVGSHVPRLGRLSRHVLGTGQQDKRERDRTGPRKQAGSSGGESEWVTVLPPRPLRLLLSTYSCLTRPVWETHTPGATCLINKSSWGRVLIKPFKVMPCPIWPKMQQM